MEYKRFGDTLVLRLDPPEEICESITAAARAENIALAEISGIGAADSFTVGVYNTVTKEYRSNTLNGAYEIVSLTGTLTSKDGEPYLHLHFSAGDENGRVSGGYLNRAAVSATADIIPGYLKEASAGRSVRKSGLICSNSDLKRFSAPRGALPGKRESVFSLIAGFPDAPATLKPRGSSPQ